MSKLKVKTLDQEIEFNGKTFKVGCQNISYDDAQEIAKFLQKQEKPKSGRELLPEKFTIKVQGLKDGRAVAKMLTELGILCHGEESSMKEFDSHFDDFHNCYNIRSQEFSGNDDWEEHDLISVEELFKAYGSL